MIHAHQIRYLISYLGSEPHVRLSNNNNPSTCSSLADARVHNDFKENMQRASSVKVFLLTLAYTETLRVRTSQQQRILRNKRHILQSFICQSPERFKHFAALGLLHSCWHNLSFIDRLIILTPMLKQLRVICWWQYWKYCFSVQTPNFLCQNKVQLYRQNHIIDDLTCVILCFLFIY